MKNNSFRLFAGLLFLWAVLLRLPTFGNPILDLDESWYLYAGGQFLQGYFPYTGIWDRKPFGLFFLYAPFSLFGTYRFLAYQIAALFCVWGTAFFILKMAQKCVTLRAGFLGGMLYLSLIMPLSGFGGQAPVFYNLLTAFAFYLIINRFEEIKRNPKTLALTGIQTMLLFGIALEIKPSVVFEGIFLGCFLLFTCWMNQKKITTLALNGLVWVTIALFPTLVIVGIYAITGHFQDWYFANILSIFIRNADIWSDKTYLLLALLAIFLLTILLILVTSFRRLDPAKRNIFYFVLAWSWAAFLGVCLSPPYLSHYFLSFALPFSLFASFVAYQNKLGKIILFAAALITGLVGEKIFFHLSSFHPKEEYYEIQKIISARPNGCLFEYGTGVTMLDPTSFMATHCHLTKYAFPNHLSSWDEEGSLGTDELAELQNILNQKPAFILVGQKYFRASPFLDKHDGHPLYPQKGMLLHNTLDKDYHLIYTHPHSEKLELFERNPPSSEKK